MDMPCLPAGLVGEDERATDRNQEREPNCEDEPPRFSHTSI